MKQYSKFVLAVLALAFWGLFAHAATIDSTVGGTGTGYAARDSGNTYVIERTLDVTNWATVGTNVVQALDITSGTVVRTVGYQILTATTNGATMTIDIGDGSDDDGFIAAGVSTSGAWGASTTLSLTSSTNGGATAISPAYGLGKFYPVDDTIDVVWNSLTTDTTTGRFRVWAVVTDVRQRNQ